MNFLNLKKEKHTITSAVFFSLLLHMTVGALLIFCISNRVISSPKLNGINLVWISLNSHNDGAKINMNRLEQSLSAVKRMSEKRVIVEIPAYDRESGQVSMSSPNKPAGNADSAKADGYGNRTNEKTNPMTAGSSKGIADGQSNSQTIIAYPLFKENTPPAYPEIARVRGYEGIVLVFAEILADGRVGKIKVGKSSGYAILDQSAVQAVKPWKFEPARRFGTPFTAWVELPIKFILNNNSQS